MTTINVRPYTRRLPEKAPDPFAPVMAARRRDFARKWGVELVGSDDTRLAAPVPEPVEGGKSMWSIISELRGLARAAARIGRG